MNLCDSTIDGHKRSLVPTTAALASSFLGSASAFTCACSRILESPNASSDLAVALAPSPLWRLRGPRPYRPWNTIGVSLYSCIRWYIVAYVDKWFRLGLGRRSSEYPRHDTDPEKTICVPFLGGRRGSGLAKRVSRSGRVLRVHRQGIHCPRCRARSQNARVLATISLMVQELVDREYLTDAPMDVS